VREDGKQRSERKWEKTNQQVEKKQNKETNKKSVKDINRERQCTIQP
jgi:hypothetical protein